jgi:hypothetical protein
MLPIALLSKKNLTSRVTIGHFQRVTARLSLVLVVATSPANQDPIAGTPVKNLCVDQALFGLYFTNVRRMPGVRLPCTPERRAQPPTQQF